jgi:hypothetical protein
MPTLHGDPDNGGHQGRLMVDFMIDVVRRAGLCTGSRIMALPPMVRNSTGTLHADR